VVPTAPPAAGFEPLLSGACRPSRIGARFTGRLSPIDGPTSSDALQEYDSRRPPSQGSNSSPEHYTQKDVHSRLKSRISQQQAAMEALREDLVAAADRERELGDAFSHMEQRVLTLERDRSDVEEECMLWRLHFAELQAAGVISQQKMAAVSSVWGYLVDAGAAVSE